MTTLPPFLIDSIREQRAILFLGSGASKDAVHTNKTPIPTGESLRDLICDKFFHGLLKDKPLSAVSAMAANEAGDLLFQKFIYDLFYPYQPASFHKLIPQFRWKAIATTNFDLIIERAYAEIPGALQKLVKSTKDGDSFDQRMSETTYPLGFYKLHGCIESYTDMTIPLILSNEQYASYEQNRQRLYSRFRDLGHEYPIIFVGYSMSDPHIQRLLFDLTSPTISRPMYYYVSPKISEIESRYWGNLRITCVDATFSDFLDMANAAIPPLARKVPAEIGGGTLSIRKHYQIANASESLDLRSYLDTDVTHVHSGMDSIPQDPRDFYHGYDRGWGCILQNLDAKRSFTDSVMVDAVLVSQDKSRPVKLYMLNGPAGNGKSVALKRIAWEAAVNFDKLVLFVNSLSGIRIDPLEEIYRLTGKQIFLFIDHVALLRWPLLNLIRACKARSIPLTIIGTERDNEWNIYCDQLEAHLDQDFPVRYLSEKEITELLVLLERHNALGILEDKAHSERVHAFTNVAERQLLVALHEATLGQPFENIVLDEYKRIEPASAQRLYLQICALHQFSVPIRAGLVSRASGISFQEFEKKFMLPLKNVVIIQNDRHTGDVFYRTRHQRIAQLVFNGAIPSPNEKFDLLVNLIGAVNVDYSSDRETFSRIIKGRAISEIFPSVEIGRLFYEHAEKISPTDAFVFQQRAIFEMAHYGGSLELAEKAAQHAFDLNPNNHSIKHTQAEVARRRANATNDPLLKHMFRRISREKVGGGTSQMSEYDWYTRTRLSVDELKEEITSLNDTSQTSPTARFIDAVKNTEATLHNAMQLFPGNAELLSEEARFRDLLNQSTQADLALKKAFNLNPRQDWLAVRLSRRYKDISDWSNCINILTRCLRDNPSSKIVHFELAHAYMKSGGAKHTILDHLRLSFTEGDNNYEGRFWFARELFLQDKFDEAEKLFVSLHDQAPGRFRNMPVATAVGVNETPSAFRGTVARLEEGYAFVRISQFPKAIFASRAESDSEDWKHLLANTPITCFVAFNRRGPQAIKVKPS